jgi:hypothetical protein
MGQLIEGFSKLFSRVSNQFHIFPKNSYRYPVLWIPIRILLAPGSGKKERDEGKNESIRYDQA